MWNCLQVIALNDADFRKEIVAGLEDDIVKRFWEEEFGRYSKSYRTEAIAPIQNKLGEFLVNPVLRRVFSDPQGTIQPRQLMDAGGVLIADLSVGKLGRDASVLLGAMLVGKFGLAALSRADMPIEQRRVSTSTSTSSRPWPRPTSRRFWRRQESIGWHSFSQCSISTSSM